jgi:hypothetical protein
MSTFRKTDASRLTPWLCATTLPLFAFSCASPGAQQPPSEGCRAASKTEYERSLWTQQKKSGLRPNSIGPPARLCCLSLSPTCGEQKRALSVPLRLRVNSKPDPGNRQKRNAQNGVVIAVPCGLRCRLEIIEEFRAGSMQCQSHEPFRNGALGR